MHVPSVCPDQHGPHRWHLQVSVSVVRANHIQLDNITSINAMVATYPSPALDQSSVSAAQVRLSKQRGSVVVGDTKVVHGLAGEALGNVEFGGEAALVTVAADDSLQVCPLC